MAPSTQCASTGSSLSIRLCCLAILLPAGASEARVISVNAEGTGEYPTIQAAISAAVAGDQVVLDQGVYTGEENRNLSLGGKAITVRSTDPANPEIVAATVIDCQGEGSGFRLYDTGETLDSVIDGLTITNAASSGVYLYRVSPTVRRCVITGNSAVGSGGGIWCRYTGAEITDCRIIGNSSGSASGTGGGIYLDRPRGTTIAHCEIAENLSLYRGGGIECSRSGDALISNCLIADNTTTYYDGAGISVWYNSTPIISHCVVSGNIADGTFARGGGVSCTIGSHPTLANCLIVDNRAGTDGGAIYSTSAMTIRHCTIIDNEAGERGGAIYGIGGEAALTVSHSILWNNEAGSGSGWELALTGDDFWGSAIAVVTYGDVRFGEAGAFLDGEATLVWGAGSTQANPLFADAEGRLSAGSPCIDAGDPAWVPEAGETDLDGHARVLCATVDIGAHEFGIGDHNCDRVVDLLDFGGWGECVTGPGGGPLASGCESFDFSADGDVDLVDYAGFQGLFAGSW